MAVHKGYCFVQYEKSASANSAIEKENGAMFLGKRIDVKPAKRGAAKEPEPPSRPEEPPRREEPPAHKPHDGSYLKNIALCTFTRFFLVCFYRVALS